MKKEVLFMENTSHNYVMLNYNICDKKDIKFMKNLKKMVNVLHQKTLLIFFCTDFVSSIG